jgi:uncharacterized RDD family membrane protein YckC
MARSIVSWLSGPGAFESEPRRRYPGEALGLPERGPGSLARLGRRLAALLVDWLLAVGLAGLAVPFGFVQTAKFLNSGDWQTTASVIWFVLGVVAVRLFSFTPGQYACGLLVASADQRAHVGVGRAVVREVMIALVIPALFIDADGRGLQDRLTRTAVVLR